MPIPSYLLFIEKVTNGMEGANSSVEREVCTVYLNMSAKNSANMNKIGQ